MGNRNKHKLSSINAIGYLNNYYIEIKIFNNTIPLIDKARKTR